jgi:hypothetical protein
MQHVAALVVRAGARRHEIKNEIVRFEFIGERVSLRFESKIDFELRVWMRIAVGLDVGYRLTLDATAALLSILVTRHRSLVTALPFRVDPRLGERLARYKSLRSYETILMLMLSLIFRYCSLRPASGALFSSGGIRSTTHCPVFLGKVLPGKPRFRHELSGMFVRLDRIRMASLLLERKT